MLETKTPSEMLRFAFEQKRQRNPRYSLRAFAKQLDIDPSSLSKILSGKRKFPPHKLRLLAEMFFENDHDKITFFKKVLDEGTRRNAQRSSLKTFELTEKEHSNIIVDWEYFAVLNVIQLEDFTHELSWISKRLGISLERVEGVIEHLIESELVIQTAEGKLLRTKQNLRAAREMNSEALRIAHEQRLNLAINSLRHTPTADREFYSITVVTNPEKIQKAKKMIHKFSERLIDFFESDSNNTEVYQLGVHLFPLTVSRENQ